MGVRKYLKKPKDEFLIAEYQEIGAFVRNSANIMWFMGTVFIPISLYCFILFDQANDCLTKWLIAVGSNALIWLWYYTCRLRDVYDDLRYSRARYIEMLLLLENHRLVNKKSKRNVIRLRDFRKTIPILITLVWIIKYLYLIYYKTLLALTICHYIKTVLGVLIDL